MSEVSAPFGIDLSTTLVGSGVTLVISGVVMKYGARVEAFSKAELFQVTGAGFLAVGVLVGIVLAIASAG